MIDFNIWKALWHPQLAPPPLTINEVHVWYASLHQLSSRHSLWEHLLSVAERERAARILLPTVRTQFVIGRIFLRKILAGYLSEEPVALRFGYGVQGKPRLQGESDLHFNLSHSADLLVVAVCRRDEIGIDAEKIRPIDDKKLASQFLTKTEANWLAVTPVVERLPKFFQMWTAKESFLKAHGTDLTSLESLELPIPLVFPTTIVIPDVAAPSNACRLVELETLPGYVCSLAILTHRLGIILANHRSPMA